MGTMRELALRKEETVMRIILLIVAGSMRDLMGSRLVAGAVPVVAAPDPEVPRAPQFPTKRSEFRDVFGKRAPPVRRYNLPRGIHRDGMDARRDMAALASASAKKAGRRNGSRK